MSSPEAFRAAVDDAARILLTGPIDPDGDSIGACLALAEAIRQVSSAQVDVAGHASHRYEWLPGAAAMVPDASVKPDYDMVVVLDGDRRRLESHVEAAFEAARVHGLIDHHLSTDPSEYHLVLLDSKAASTCEIVDRVCRDWGCELSPSMAQALYTGVIFDTGGFRYSNTSPATHELASRLLASGIDHAAICVRVLMERRPQGLRLMGQVLAGATFHADGQIVLASVSRTLLDQTGADKTDLEGVVDALVFTRGVEVACLCVERRPDRVKLSLRSRLEVDVARLAQGLHSGGGGHARAAGVVLVEPLQSALARLPGVIEKALIDTRATVK